ncbi:MAG TPA: arsinothricin resistance N-acetyltransferase ArsN1 family A [Dehalococcoidia bacterium]|nr:arsinothricin resistance N-acetyltransferase ArsN1 family A [Dehalococcoidia bacterium]
MTNLRLARLDDATAIARIYTQGIEDRIATFETEPRSTVQLEAILCERGEAYPTVVAERDGRVFAWAGAAPYSERPCYAGIGACSVYVERAQRGSGAGRLVLMELIRVYEALGFWKLTSRIFPENTASRAMCRACGFREVGTYRRHGQFDGRWRDCVIVERLLGPAANGSSLPR